MLDDESIIPHPTRRTLYKTKKPEFLRCGCLVGRQVMRSKLGQGGQPRVTRSKSCFGQIIMCVCVCV